MSNERLIALRRELAARELDGALLTSLPNIRYLCGFTGSNALLLVTQRRAVLWTDPRYTVQAEAETEGSGVKAQVVKGALEPTAVKQLAKLRRVGLENSRIRYGTWELLGGPAAGLQPLGELLSEMRMVKSAAEIRLIRESVQVNSRAFDAALGHFRAGMTESDLAAEIEYQMRLLGAEKPSFDTIVAFRQNSARPHAQPGAAKIDGNGILLIDMGTLRGGYASDMTRCVHLGKPGPKSRQLYGAVLSAQLAALDAVGPGVSAHTVDAAARGVLKQAGLDKAFVHSTGHGLGLEIHELPRLGKGNQTKLSAGMAITIEPGAYLPGVHGVRIEDTVLVTPTGVEVLTPTTKEFTVL